MPNLFAYLAIFTWPIVTILMFRMMPLQKALVWSLIGGYLLLPTGTEIKFPMLPAIDKAMVTCVPALILCLLMAPAQPPTRDPLARTGRHVLVYLLAIVLVSPILTVVQNTAPVIDGRTYLPGLRLYDAFGLISQVLVSLIPFWLGLRYLNSREGHRIILKALALGGLAYTIPVLFEVRFSPQLHTWVYGFFPHSFAQHIRNGGFRPVVFLSHGLLVGIFLCISAIAAIALFREAKREGKSATKWLLSGLWLLAVLLMSKNFGAMSIAVGLAAAVLLLGRRPQVTLAVIVATVVILYPILRGAGWIPVNAAHDIVQSIDAERAASLKFRLDNEDALLARANEKPLAGWGSWGRNMIYDPATGQSISTVDGIWIILIGVFGWIGYIGRFGLLTAPILFFALRRSVTRPSFIPVGVIMVLCATLIDLLPNSGLENYVWLIAGAVAGYVLWQQAPTEDGVASGAVSGSSTAGPLPEPTRASWLMPDTGPTRQRSTREAEARRSRR